MSPVQRLGLGTVQWGMPYGITNRQGMTPPSVVGTLLSQAREARLALLDTAWAYGEAEKVLGEQGAASLGFSIVTKTRPLKGLGVASEEAARMVEDSFRTSLGRLRVPSVYGLMTHHADDLLGLSGDAIWGVMKRLQREGLVQKIGSSLYSPQQFFDLMARYPLELVQIPYNIYDQRLVTSGMAGAARAGNVEVHARSAFLQGILLSNPEQLPTQFHGIRDHHISLWSEFASRGLSPLQATLGFCLSCPDIAKVVVGCEGTEQLTGILEAVIERPLGVAFDDFARFSIHDETVINPGRWR